MLVLFLPLEKAIEFQDNVYKNLQNMTSKNEYLGIIAIRGLMEDGKYKMEFV